MSTEKPKKRLVSKREYLKTLLGKGGFYSYAMACAVGGGVLLIVSLFLLWLGLPPWDNLPDVGDRIWMFLCGVILGVPFVAAVWFGVSFFKAGRRMEPVAPITRHNTGQLPEVETLARASDAPPSNQQAELLRAAQYCKETPAEELLRATTRNGQD